MTTEMMMEMMTMVAIVDADDDHWLMRLLLMDFGLDITTTKAEKYSFVIDIYMGHSYVTVEIMLQSIVVVLRSNI